MEWRCNTYYFASTGLPADDVNVSLPDFKLFGQISDKVGIPFTIRWRGSDLDSKIIPACFRYSIDAGPGYDLATYKKCFLLPAIKHGS